MDLLVLRIASFIVIAFLYMLFDVFNDRNIPEIFAYGTLAYCLVLTVLYLNVGTIATSLAIAGIVGAVGYLIYKAGQIGAGDVIELACLSLILPFQSYTFFTFGLSQSGMPTIIALLIDSGIAAMVFVPLYYLPVAKRLLKKPLTSYLDTSGLIKAITIGAVYLAFLLFLAYLHTEIIGLAALALLAVGSVITLAFQKPITESMVMPLTWKEMTPEDMIAFNLMEKKDIERIKKHIKSFDRLVTKEMLHEMKEKDFSEKIPVYRNALPLALPIFIGAIATILAGNLILFILPLHV